MTTASLRVEPGLPLIGNLLEFRRDRLGFQLRVADAGITRTRIANRTVYIITDADLAHEVLVTHEDAFIKGPGLAIVAKPLLGDGLLTAEKDAHRRARKLLAPAFTPRRMAGYAAVMAERAATHVARVRPGAMVDIAERMMSTTLDIVGKTLFDADLTGDARAIGDALTEAMEYVLATVLSPIPIGWPTPRRKHGLAAVARLDEVVLRVIAARRCIATTDTVTIAPLAMATPPMTTSRSASRATVCAGGYSRRLSSRIASVTGSRGRSS